MKTVTNSGCPRNPFRQWLVVKLFSCFIPLVLNSCFLIKTPVTIRSVPIKDTVSVFHFIISVRNDKNRGDSRYQTQSQQYERSKFHFIIKIEIIASKWKDLVLNCLSKSSHYQLAQFLRDVLHIKPVKIVMLWKIRFWKISKRLTIL